MTCESRTKNRTMGATTLVMKSVRRMVSASCWVASWMRAELACSWLNASMTMRPE